MIWRISILSIFRNNLLRILGDKIKGINGKDLVLKKVNILNQEWLQECWKCSEKSWINAFWKWKHLLEYDDVANEQRKVIYSFRNDLLKPDYDIDSKLDENRIEYIQNLLSECSYNSWNAKWRL